jgi:valyl-tRNA synthetase
MIELNVNPSPVLPTDLTDLVLCDQDNNPQNGQTFFDLSVQTPVILEAQTPGNYSVRYFTSEAAANANTPAIINITNYPNATNPQIIWYRVQDLDTGCFTVGNFQLIVNTPLALVTPPALALCDDNDDGFLVFDLTIRSELIAQGLDNHTVTYYPSYAAALAQTNPIVDPTAYTNAVNPQTLGVVVTTPQGCTSVTTLTIRVLNLPTPNTAPALLVACDDEFPGDGITFFDLTVNEGFIADSDNSLTFAYYPTQQDAVENTNEILDPTNYQGATGTIWIKVMNQQFDYNGEACYVLVAQELLVNPQPTIVEDLVYPICMRNSTGVAVFTLSSMNPEVLGPDQDVADYTVSYYLTPEDAQAGVNPLSDTYTNITNPQEIYIRVVNNATGCVNPVGSLILIVEEAAVGNPVDFNDPALTQCDTDGTNDGQIIFDLTQFTGDIIAGNPQGVTIHYYDNMDDLNTDLAAGLGVHDNAIANPAAYTNTIPEGQSVYALLVNMDTTTGCPDIIEIPLTVNLLPEPVIEDGLVCVDFETGNVLSDYTFNTGLDQATHSFVWTYNGTPLPQGSTSITVTQPGTYTVTATNLITGCVSETQTAVVVQSGAPLVSAAVSNAFTENQIITVTATGNTVGGLNPNWAYALDFGPFQESNVFTNVSPGTHTITVMDLNGCGETSITVTAINYPKYFTPNGDGYNDTWNIIGLNQQPNAIIYIFDRYGKLLKQISATSAGWDGTFNGQPLPSTDYWFTVNYSEDNQWKEFKAHFSLKR